VVGLASRQPISPRVRAEIERILRKNLSRYGFVRAGVEPGDDHDGDPAIFIDAEYVLSDDPVDVNTVIKTRSLLRDRLSSLGEERYPYLRNHFAENQKVLGND
jgi:hypothetical protein